MISRFDFSLVASFFCDCGTGVSRYDFLAAVLRDFWLVALT
jgi:hypothetical protein